MQKKPKPKTEKTQRAWFKDEIKSRLSERERETETEREGGSGGRERGKEGGGKNRTKNVGGKTLTSKMVCCEQTNGQIVSNYRWSKTTRKVLKFCYSVKKKLLVVLEFSNLKNLTTVSLHNNNTFMNSCFFKCQSKHLSTTGKRNWRKWIYLSFASSL